MENNKKIRELYEIYLELGHDEFEQKIKKSMENHLHDGSNVITINSLHTIANAMEKSKLGEASFYKNDPCSSPALEEKICLDNTLSPICDNSNDTCDILNPSTESISFEIPMEIVEMVMNERYAGDGTVHPHDHLLKLIELCELIEVAGLSREDVMGNYFHFHLRTKQRSGIGCWMIVLRIGHFLNLCFTLNFVLFMKYN